MNQNQTSVFRDKLRLKSLEAQNAFKKDFPHAHQFLLEKGLEIGKIRQHSAKLISAGALTGTLLLAPPSGGLSLPPVDEIVKSVNDLNDQEKKSGFIPEREMVNSLDKLLPQQVRPLSREEEKHLEVVISNLTGLPAKATLEGEHLNTTYGLIGAEQHLKRYPGDVLENHGPYYKEGMAPGLGAWGYFAKSQSEMTPDLVEKERWYSVAQTLYLPDWNERQPHLKNWYKHRKLLILNTDNGKAVVTALSDSGPAAWTGKHFGGSPEVMEYLGGSRYKKGPVIVFFVDDPENKIKLGPVDYNNLGISDDKLLRI